MKFLRDQQLRQQHASVFGTREPLRTVEAPYRVCPLGAHIDHQLGVVTGFALDAGVRLCFTPNPAGIVRLRSLDFEGAVEFPLTQVAAAASGDWGNYARGAAAALGRQHPLRIGIDGVIGGSLPIGGLSSSAAAGLCYLAALEQANGISLPARENIRLDQSIENDFIGLFNGLLDPSVILLGREGELLSFDCRSGEHRSIAPPDTAPAFEIAVVYSGVSRSLASTAYNERVAECREAARALLARAGSLAPAALALRNVPEEMFEEFGAELPEPLRRRAAHFFGESRRVRAGVDAWQRGDLARFGQLVAESGESSIRNYECGAPPLVTLHRLLAEAPGVYGARFSGGGFRGFCIALVAPGRADSLEAHVGERYRAAHPEQAPGFSVHFCKTSSGPGAQ
jgi:galactokinase